MSYKRFIVFILNMDKKTEQAHENNLDVKEPHDFEFPTDWGLLTDDDNTRVFQTLKEAMEYLKLHIYPNRIYRICSWTVVPDYKIFSNKTKLTEVLEI